MHSQFEGRGDANGDSPERWEAGSGENALLPSGPY